VQQAWRYVFVSGTSAGLNAGGVALLLLLPGASYRISWVITRAVIFLTWNYPLLRGFVFQDPRPPGREGTTSDPSLTEGGASGASRAA